MVRLTAPDPTIAKHEGFTGKNDLFDLRNYAEKLTNLISNAEDPLVLAIDGNWGTGKSVFAKQWTELIRCKGGTVIFFDAFGNDHHQDPFIALSSEILNNLKSQIDNKEIINREIFQSTKNVARRLIPIAGKSLLNALTYGAVNQISSDQDLAGIIEAAKSATNDAEDQIDLMFEKHVKKSLSDEAIFQKFRENLTREAQELRKNPSNIPLTIIIDDLDRCRPNFSIELLEKIKKLFQVENVTFVLVVDLEQLSLAIQGMYGPNFDSRKYLEKFYSISTRLPSQKIGDMPTTRRFCLHLRRELNLNSLDQDREDAVSELTRILTMKNSSLRETEKCFTHLVATMASCPEHQIYLGKIVAIGCAMRYLSPDIYRKFREKSIRKEEFIRFLSDQNKDSHRKEVLENLFSTLFEQNIAHDLRQYSHHSIDRDEIIPYCIQLIEMYQ